MRTLQVSPVSSRGFELDTAASSFGELRDSSLVLHDPAALRHRMEEDGYVFIRNFFKREEVMFVRRELVTRMVRFNLLEPGTDPMQAIARLIPTSGMSSPGNDDFAKNNPSLEELLYGTQLISFYQSYFGEAVRHFDHTWMRMMPPGLGTPPHCDVVYMGRGTREKLHTAWIPMGDAPMDVGGLMILEGSHLQHERLNTYLNRDVDAYCSNSPGAARIENGIKNGVDLRSANERWGGSLSKNPATLREKLGGRWLTTNYQAGDLLTFSMHTVHASIDNHSNRYRISTDSRYQPSSLPADERWMGENPPGHSLAGKRGRIC